MIISLVQKPAERDPKFKTWKIKNNMVMVNQFMNNDVSENFLLYKTAQQIWEAANHILIMKTQLNPSRLTKC